MNPRRLAELHRERARIDLAIAEEYERVDAVIEGEYSSTRLPPGISSREHFATECRRLKIGAKHGREWHVAARDWANARSAKKQRSHLQAVPPPASALQMADDDIEASGARATRRSR